MKLDRTSMLYATLVLTGTSLASQLLGFLYRILLSRLIGAEIMGLYQLIMPVYSVVMSITAVGLTVAMSNLSSEYKVIFVGDAQMAPYELTGGWYYGRDRDPSLPQCGMDWLERFRDKYPHIIWINPSERPSWGQYWCETYDAIARVFPMFPLTVDGLEAGMKKLLAR